MKCPLPENRPVFQAGSHAIKTRNFMWKRGEKSSFTLRYGGAPPQRINIRACTVRQSEFGTALRVIFSVARLRAARSRGGTLSTSPSPEVARTPSSILFFSALSVAFHTISANQNNTAPPTAQRHPFRWRTTFCAARC